MAKATTQKSHGTTQKFTEIIDIVEDVVLLDGGRACMVIEITASNFALLSKAEQDSKLYSYASLLNSLTFPVQILIRNKRIDISSYIKELEEHEKKVQNKLLADYVRQYKEFVKEMVKVNVVLNKAFYAIVPYSSLESGVGGVKQAVGGSATNTTEAFAKEARKVLLGKSESVLGQLRKLATSAEVLGKEQLVKLFYDVYNEGALDATQVDADTKTVVIKSA